ncbi:T9SS sorting signal type C domain-containing protein, partial [Flavobacterium sp.]|uniref:T9SS sorting signal type C domain-containing protein n=1 Tax=Flavobacterium sp. TaxID=239 RepID=UPI002B4AF306
LNLDGFVNFWTHGTLPGSALNPFYGSYAYNYTANDYITFNGTGTTSGPSGFNGYIAAGQGFFVMMDDGAADATQTITFNNSMRSKDYDNAQFYRNSASNLVEGTEKHRIWLDLISSTNAVNRMLVGYVAGATLGRDRLYDAVTKVDNNQNFYSLLTNQAYKIQGRPVPFDTNDQVPLGVKLPASGSYTIALGATDGLFLGVAYPIFLEDKLLNIIHDLKQAPYSFTAVAGKFDNRFVLRYTNVNLGNDDFVITENHVAIATGNQEVVVKSQIEPIENIAVYDVLGRLVFEKNNINTTEFTIRNMIPNQQALIIRIALENGQTINRKIVF